MTAYFLEIITKRPLDLWYFLIKQAKAAVFGGVLLIAIITTHFFAIPYINRLDFLFLVAILTQLWLIADKHERPREVFIIAIFHLLATMMELFKTSGSVGSWTYSNLGFFTIATVPLFAGFMYSAVGSYLARAWRIFKFSFTNYPPLWSTYILAALAYVNFISHHYFFDLRYILFAFSAIIFWRTSIYFQPMNRRFRMPMLLGFFLVASVIFLAENLATFATIWAYPNQIAGWQVVPWSKLGSWYLLIIVSFVLVSTVFEIRKEK